MAPTIATPPPDAAVRALLADLGLAHLIGVFAEHEVDDAAFLQLKDGDLRDINISRGNRRKILTAIQTIKEQERQWAPSIVTPPPSPVTECGICMDASVEVRVVGCGHTMCSSCAAGWFARTPAGQVTECPTCRGPCTDFEPLVPPVPIVESAVEFPRHQIFVGKAYDMTTPQLVHLFKGVGRVVDAFIMTDSAGRSKGCGMVEFSEPEAVARAIEVWRQKRHPRWSKLIVERVRRARFADAAASKRAVVAGTPRSSAPTRRAKRLCAPRPRRRELRGSRRKWWRPRLGRRRLRREHVRPRREWRRLRRERWRPRRKRVRPRKIGCGRMSRRPSSELRTLDSWRSLMLPRQPRPLRLRAPPRLNGNASRTSSSCRLGRISRIPTI
jgi:hypothetical protein